MPTFTRLSSPSTGSSVAVGSGVSTTAGDLDLTVTGITNATSQQVGIYADDGASGVLDVYVGSWQTLFDSTKLDSTGNIIDVVTLPGSPKKFRLFKGHALA